MSKRFIDLANHGGCSQKCDAARLQGVLGSLAEGMVGATGPDAGTAWDGDHLLAGSVDIVLPMIDDPALFGRIAALHSLSDLYAVGAFPLFALNVLGLPGFDSPSGPGQDDPRIAEMLEAADAAVATEGAVSVGGHTIGSESLFFGLSVTGRIEQPGNIGIDRAKVGDRLVLTKPLGTSVATKAWKTEALGPDAFGDVVTGMLRSNRAASVALRGRGRIGCTDISGFGFLGHLYNLLVAGHVAADIEVAAVPVYESVRAFVGPGSATRIFEPNVEFVAGSANLDWLSLDNRILFCDAQISGGLLAAMPAVRADEYIAALAEMGEQGWLVGEIVEGAPGAITLS
jgi:selenide,water dikinase